MFSRITHSSAARQTVLYSTIKLAIRSPAVAAGKYKHVPYLAANEKPFYITTPIFYVNAAPHLGHLYLMLLCDVRNRWEVLARRPSFFMTGTDEHGLKVQLAAKAKGFEATKPFVDQVLGNFKTLADLTDIKYDRFIRTTDADHLRTVAKFWGICQTNGYIYQAEHSGWYSISDETFYPETQIVDVVENGVAKKVSKETGSEVTFESEFNYFFRLSHFQERLIRHMEENQDFIQPHKRHMEILRELKAKPLEDLSISRSSSRLQWAIDVPNDPSQKVYVWFDALTNYLTSCGFANPDWSADASAWGNTTHLIGKDIVRFHSIYWPALLMACEVPLPKQLIVHSHWLCDGRKMSKSVGNVVDPIAMAQYYDSDALRWFLCENSSLENDCDFSEERLHVTRDLLIGKFANLISRCCSKSFNVERALKSYAAGELTTPASLEKFTQLSPEAAKLYHELVAEFPVLLEQMEADMTGFRTNDALDRVWNVLNKANLFITHAAPWHYKKQAVVEDAEVRKVQDLIIFMGVDVARNVAILTKPFIPNLANKLLDRIGVAPDNRDLYAFGLGKDVSYGKGVNGAGELPITRKPMRGTE
ncbi:hypothetical protein BABINDRAFT_161020 [Babjeviella inositovora NRRL Y-12698]|uniref:Methionine--tRNA ligase, mitochondrial n=1 Tax=Babjeviella inositovora NRRL Y-12698 TaxID=984486 RepID=A0A1E3QSX9_9ASCO|nr:uncharacterized protein BABINDRAFT_161020 [Babjeviella inositovora NRRL Y-12698]ODQ80816.1 hypothetical protein BABINDRAFT_161020 [Babjeviella inositovora NRRL Y-12698]